MSSQHRAQVYLEKHRIGQLFEDLSNRVVHDMPDEPITYIIALLYRKAGLDVPQEFKLGSLRRSTTDIPRARGSPEMSRKNVTMAWASSSLDRGHERPYDRPWQSPTKKPKTKKSGTGVRLSEDGTASGRHRHTKSTTGRKSALDEFFQPSPGRQDWNPDNRVKTATFDDIWNDKPADKGKEVHRNGQPDTRKSWAMIGMGDDSAYSSGTYTGPKRQRHNEDDPLAGELSVSKYETNNVNAAQTSKSSRGRVKGPRLQVNSRHKELEKAILKEKMKSHDSGIDADPGQSEDEAIELLEDGDLLRREGAFNVKSSGFKLSRGLRQKQGQPEVKLNINLYAGGSPSMPATGKYDNITEFDSGSDVDESRPQTATSVRFPLDSEDEEVESASQVTGPRKLTWKSKDSDVDTYMSEMSIRSPRHGARHADGANQQSRKSERQRVAFEQAGQHASPLRTQDMLVGQSMDSEDLFGDRTRKNWSPEFGRKETRKTDAANYDSLQSKSGGWNIADDSDISMVDWRKGVHPSQQKY